MGRIAVDGDLVLVLTVSHEAGDEGDGPEDHDANDEESHSSTSQVIALTASAYQRVRGIRRENFVRQKLEPEPRSEAAKSSA
jgi:hypothetical protein